MTETDEPRDYAADPLPDLTVDPMDEHRRTDDAYAERILDAQEAEAERRAHEGELAEEVTPGRELVHPATGEVLALDGPTDELARARRELIDLKAELDAAATHIDAELAARLDKANTRTAEVGRWRLKVNAPSSEEVNVGGLIDGIRELGALDVLDDVVVLSKLITYPPAPAPKVNRAELGKLKRHPDERVRALVARVTSASPTPRRVTVEVRA